MSKFVEIQDQEEIFHDIPDTPGTSSPTESALEEYSPEETATKDSLSDETATGATLPPDAPRAGHLGDESESEEYSSEGSVKGANLPPEAPRAEHLGEESESEEYSSEGSVKGANLPPDTPKEGYATPKKRAREECLGEETATKKYSPEKRARDECSGEETSTEESSSDTSVTEASLPLKAQREEYSSPKKRAREEGSDEEIVAEESSPDEKARIAKRMKLKMGPVPDVICKVKRLITGKYNLAVRRVAWAKQFSRNPDIIEEAETEAFVILQYTNIVKDAEEIISSDEPDMKLVTQLVDNVIDNVDFEDVSC